MFILFCGDSCKGEDQHVKCGEESCWAQLSPCSMYSGKRTIEVCTRAALGPCSVLVIFMAHPILSSYICLARVGEVMDQTISFCEDQAVNLHVAECITTPSIHISLESLWRGKTSPRKTYSWPSQCFCSNV